MAAWTRDEHLTFDIAFALKNVTIPGFRKALKEEDRIAIAATILEHLKLCRWEFSKPNEAVQYERLLALPRQRPTLLCLKALFFFKAVAWLAIV